MQEVSATHTKTFAGSFRHKHCKSINPLLEVSGTHTVKPLILLQEVSGTPENHKPM